MSLEIGHYLSYVPDAPCQSPEVWKPFSVPSGILGMQVLPQVAAATCCLLILAGRGHRWRRKVNVPEFLTITFGIVSIMVRIDCGRFLVPITVLMRESE